MQTKFRNGSLGALMDEYVRAVKDLQKVLKRIDVETYVKVLDAGTKDKDCRSIQTITNHVVRAAYGYANYIRKHFGDNFTERKTDYQLATPKAVISELNKALDYTENTFEKKWHFKFGKLQSNIIHTAWGQKFDIDQLMEHAIVHILRHRRQIERLLQNNNH